MTPDDHAMRERLVASIAGEWMDDPAERDPETCGTQVMRYDEDEVLAFAASEVRRALDELAKLGETSRLDEWIEDVGEEELAGPQLDDLTQAVRKDIAAALALAEQESAALRHQLERYQHEAKNKERP